LEFAGAFYHVTARGDRQEPIFLNDSDRRKFLDLLNKEVTQQGWRCYAYCLMDNHDHLLLETPEPIWCVACSDSTGYILRPFVGIVGGRLFASPGRQSLLAGGRRTCGRVGGKDLSDPNYDGSGENKQAGALGVTALETIKS
jgi:hypothetical protein